MKKLLSRIEVPPRVQSALLLFVAMVLLVLAGNAAKLGRESLTTPWVELGLAAGLAWMGTICGLSAVPKVSDALCDRAATVLALAIGIYVIAPRIG